MIKELSHVMLELHNVSMESLNVRKKGETTECDKKTVTYVVGTAQCKDETIKCEKKKVRELLNMRKKLSHVMLELHNVRMELSNVRKK